LGDGGVYCLAKMARAGGAGDVGVGARLYCGVGEMAFWQLAMGDDPQAGIGAVKPPDRLRAGDRVAVAVATPAHVDDRHVEVADVPDEVQGLVTSWGLVEDEAAVQGLSNSESDKGVAVDDQAMWGLAQDSIRSIACVCAGTGGLCGSRLPILPSRGVR
jgi:hypothetical protein